MRPSLTALNNEINTEVQNAVINASMPLLIKTHHLEGKHDDEYESRCPLCEVKRQKGRYQKDGIWYYANGEVIEWDEDLEAPFENLDEMTNMPNCYKCDKQLGIANWTGGPKKFWHRYGCPK
jgi:hypothetical protein